MRDTIDLSSNPSILGFHTGDVIATLVVTVTLGFKLRDAMPDIFLGYGALLAVMGVTLYVASQLRQHLPPGFVVNFLEWLRQPDLLKVGPDTLSRRLIPESQAEVQPLAKPDPLSLTKERFTRSLSPRSAPEATHSPSHA